jgi:hydroxymethylbilane synthase
MLSENSPIKLGVRRNAWHKLFGVYAQSTLRKKHIDSTIVYYADRDALYKALLAGDIHALPKPLKDVPTQLPEGIVITALTEREDVRMCFVMPKNAENTEGGYLALSDLKNVRIGVENAILGAQIEALLPDNQAIVVDDFSPLDVVERIRRDDFQACILTSITVRVLSLTDENWHIISFSPREFVPEAGQGVACLITAADDVLTRRLVKPFHHPSVTPLVNVERTIKKLLNDEPIAAYCERDANNNFHVWAAALVNGQLKKARLSQTTSVLLAERVVEILSR